MNILALCRDYPPYNVGGMGLPLYYLVKYGMDKGLKFTLLTNHPYPKIVNTRVNNITQIFIPTLGKTFLTKIPSYTFFSSLLVKKLQENCDIIYSLSSHFITHLTKPLICHIQGTRYGEYIAAYKIGWTLAGLLNKSFLVFDKMMIAKGDGLVFPSAEMITEVFKFCDVKQKQYTVIPNGVDTTIFYPGGRKEFNSFPKKILYVGRLDRRKGLEIFFYVLKKLKGKVKFKFIIVGTGREKKRLLTLANKLGLPVEFRGRIEYQRLPEIYNSADLFVLPSIYEPFGMVALEAMACGVPTVVSSYCPITEVPRFDPYDINRTADMLTELLTSTSKLKTLSEKCEEIARRYDWRLIVDEIIDFLNRFVK
jgi:glycosyltransferase involved in cell wall biosynthesis